MKFNLGKGLQSLIPNKSNDAGGDAQNIYSEVRRESVFNIDVGKIKPNPHQPRQAMDENNLRELAESIKEHGILQPLVLTKFTKETPRGEEPEYYLIAGHRRLAAAKMLKMPHVPAIIRNTTSREKLELALVENIQREDLNAIEKARAFQQLQADFRLTQAEIAQKIGKSRESVTNTIRLLGLPEKIQNAVLANYLTEGHAKTLIGIKDEKMQDGLFNEIIDKKLNVRQAEQRYRDLVLNPVVETTRTAPVYDAAMEKTAEKIKNFLGCRVALTKSGLGGKIIIHFADNKELEGVVKKIIKS